MDYNLPGSSVHEISQARILERVVIFFSRGSSRPRDLTCISCQCRCQRCHWLFTTKPPGTLHLGVERTLILQQNPLSEHNCVLSVYTLRKHLSCYLHMVSGRKKKKKDIQKEKESYDTCLVVRQFPKIVLQMTWTTAALFWEGHILPRGLFCRG